MKHDARTILIARECAIGAGGGAVAGALALTISGASALSPVLGEGVVLDAKQAFMQSGLVYAQASLIGAVLGLALAVFFLPREE